MMVYTKSVMKNITVLLLAVFLIPFVPNVNAQNILDQITGPIKELAGGAGQSANNTGQQAQQSAGQAGQSAGQAGQSAGQAGQNATSTAGQAGQNATNATGGNNTSGGAGGVGDMLGNLIPGQ